MARQPALTDDQIKEVRALYAQGIGSTTIAERFGVSPTTVMKAIPESERRSVGHRKPATRDVVKRYQGGESVREVAEAYGVHRRTIRAILDEAGVSRRPTGTHPIDLPERELADAYRAGSTTRALAREYGISESTVRRALDRQGVEMRPTGYAPALSEEQKQEARTMREQGMSTAELAAHFNVSGYVMRKIVRGVTSRTQEGLS